MTSRILRHERLVVAGGVALLAALCWWYVLSGAGMDGPMAMPPPLTALVLMWWLMMAAMMLPSAAPAILLYARVRQSRSRDSGVAHSGLFLAGYLMLWLLFSMAAALAQQLLTGASMVLDSNGATGGLLIAAGLYRLSPVKGACLGECRSPAQFVSRHWRPGVGGALRLGLLHGAYCVGCCWVLMLLLFVGGVMNLLWVVALAAIVAIEKLIPHGARLGRVLGIGLLLWGSARIAGF